MDTHKSIYEDTENSVIDRVYQSQDKFFKTGDTHHLDFRLNQLDKFEKGLRKHEKNLQMALHADLNRNDFQSYLLEFSVVYNEIKSMKENLGHWIKPKKVHQDMIAGFGESYMVRDPLGQCLVISPWNYPLQLSLVPVIGAIAGGNCTMIKPSEVSVSVQDALKGFFDDTFPEELVYCTIGGPDVNTHLLTHQWGRVFFTGSIRVGRIVAEAAGKTLSPVTLELGGSNPCFVTKNCDLKRTAKRLVWSKFSNAGQTCLAPNYLVVEEGLEEKLIPLLKEQIAEQFSDNPKESDDYCRLITDAAFDRVSGLIGSGQLAAGGKTDRDQRYIAPTIITGVSWDDEVIMQETFGPLLPIITYTDLDETVKLLRDRWKPLALYVFSNDKKEAESIYSRIPSGGVVVNDCLLHCANDNLKFGGFGESGMGGYHGWFSFDAFTHDKAVLKASTHFDVPMRFFPGTKGKLETLRTLWH